jgi:hypothetical protein
MNDDDLYGPKLTPPPQTSPIVRGAAVAVVTVSLAIGGCSSTPGVPVADTGLYASDTGPDARLIDTGIFFAPDAGPDATPQVDGGNPGLGVFDAGIDTGNPDDHP